jgi:hypothetical protein
VGLIGSFYERHTSLGWNNMPEVRIEYDLIFGLIVLYLVVASIGLIKRKRWGYILSIAANSILVVTPLLIFIVVLIMLNELSVIDQVKASAGNFLVSLVSITFIYLLRKKQVKCLFQV